MYPFLFDEIQTNLFLFLSYRPRVSRENCHRKRIFSKTLQSGDFLKTIDDVTAVGTSYMIIPRMLNYCQVRMLSIKDSSVFSRFSVFARTAENDSNTQRAGDYFQLIKTETCGQGLCLLIATQILLHSILYQEGNNLIGLELQQ